MTEKDSKTCFLISPIGRQGTDRYEKFKVVLEHLVKPAVEDSGYQLKVVRADEIERSGSFIKDILDHLLNCHVVIADLSEQNANVFYELGVRHALSPRTILIAQSIDDIPSDLREYRAIVYEVSLPGAAVFKGRVKKFINEINADPNRPDNPVLDRLPGMMDRQIAHLEQENLELRQQLEQLMQNGPEAVMSSKPRIQPIAKRVRRIAKLLGWVWYQSPLGYRITFADDEWGTNERSYKVPTVRGDWTLHVREEGKLVYLAEGDEVDWENLLAEARVLTAELKGTEVPVLLVVAVGSDLGDQRGAMEERFERMFQFVPETERKRFSFELWDEHHLEQTETDLGLRL